ncbi:MAG: hypothetical protein KF693_12160 [Nitrospira sp.]|nr:hypothetical protein [Nitrospira sp.]
MNRTINGFVILWIATLLIPIHDAQARDLSDKFGFSFPASIEEEWERVLLTVPTRERRIGRQIKLAFEHSGIITSPYAIFKNGEPTIMVPWEFTVMMMALVDVRSFTFFAVPLGMDLDPKGLIYAKKRYLKYVAERLKQGKRGQARQSDEIKSALEWIAADRSQIEIWENNRYVMREQFDAMMMFALAHEAAHHLLGHTHTLSQPHRPLEVLKIIKEGRPFESALDQESSLSPELKEALPAIGKELEADGWAADTLIRSGVNPVLMVHIFEYYHALNCTTLERMESDMYIADTLRLLHFVNVALDNGFYWEGRTQERNRKASEPRPLPQDQSQALIKVKNKITDFLPDVCMPDFSY